MYSEYILKILFLSLVGDLNYEAADVSFYFLADEPYISISERICDQLIKR